MGARSLERFIFVIALKMVAVGSWLLKVQATFLCLSLTDARGERKGVKDENEGRRGLWADTLVSCICKINKQTRRVDIY